MTFAPLNGPNVVEVRGSVLSTQFTAVKAVTVVPCLLQELRSEASNCMLLQTNKTFSTLVYTVYTMRNLHNYNMKF